MTDGRIPAVRALVTGLLAAGLLLWVAWYNGYPTVFSDTGSYLVTGAFFYAMPPFRAPGYSMFTRMTSLGLSGWYVIAAQAVIAVYVLYEACDYLVDGDRELRERLFLGSVCVLAAGTSLPWLVSLLMPDVFAGVLFLSAFLLAFAGKLSAVRRASLAVILVISVSAHSSLLPISICFVPAAIVMRRMASRQAASLSMRSAATWLVVPVLAAGVFTVTLNREMGLGFRIAPAGNDFLLGRLFSDGLAARFLHDSCPKHDFIACRYLGNLPRTQEEFLFQHPLLRDLRGHDDEKAAIVRGTLRAFPLRFAASSVRGTFLQLAAIRTGDEIRSYGAKYWNNSAMQRVFPLDVPAFSRSRQMRGALLSLANGAAKIDSITFWLSAVLCLWIARTGRFARINGLFYSALAFLFINAAVCATFAGVYDRYQSRVAWIIPFCLVAYASGFAEECGIIRSRGPAEPGLTNEART